MAGNSQRRGAIRKAGQEGPTVGSGGQRRTRPRGPGPDAQGATERTTHPAAKRRRRKRAGSAAAQAAPAPHGRGAPQGRRKAPSEIVAGRNSVVEALRARCRSRRCTSPSRHRAPTTGSARRSRSPPTAASPAARGAARRARPAHRRRRPPGARPAGAAVRVRPPDDLLDAPRPPGIPLIVALDGVTDPRNLGAIVRSAAAFGAHGVVVPERRVGRHDRRAWKTSAGAAARVPVARATNLTRALEELPGGRAASSSASTRTATSQLPDLELGHRAAGPGRRLRGQGPVPAGRARRATRSSRSRWPRRSSRSTPGRHGRHALRDRPARRRALRRPGSRAAAASDRSRGRPVPRAGRRTRVRGPARSPYGVSRTTAKAEADHAHHREAALARAGLVDDQSAQPRHTMRRNQMLRCSPAGRPG